jgi:predicted AAA+ superfamily ATPase
MPRLLRILAQHSGKPVNYSSVGAPLDIGHVTAQKYTGALEQLLLIRTGDAKAMQHHTICP